MKKILKIVILIIFYFMLYTCMYKVQAATASISASPTSAKVGDNVSINVKYTAASWNLTISGEGISTTKLADVTEDAENVTKTKTISLNTSKAGTYEISLKGDISDGNTGVTSNVDTSVTITIKEREVVLENKENAKEEVKKPVTQTQKPSTTKNNKTTTTTTKPKEEPKVEETIKELEEKEEVVEQEENNKEEIEVKEEEQNNPEEQAIQEVEKRIEEKSSKEQKIISMPVTEFIILQVAIIGIEIIAYILISKIFKYGRRKK